MPWYPVVFPACPFCFDSRTKDENDRVDGREYVLIFSGFLIKLSYVMDKKNKNISKNKGFTLIELLTVLAILMILSAIAIPFFLGQREKAKVSTMISSAKGSVSEIQSWFDAFLAGEPFVALANGIQTCFEANNAGQMQKCSSVLPNYPGTGTYQIGDLSSLITIIVNHHRSKNERSPFNSAQDLFVGTTGIGGTIVVSGVGSRTIQMTGFGSGASNIIFSTIITGR